LSGKNRGGWRYAAWGLLLACALLTKASAVFLLMLWPIAYLQNWSLILPHLMQLWRTFWLDWSQSESGHGSLGPIRGPETPLQIGGPNGGGAKPPSRKDL
jgi:hypothetical protein